MNKNFIAIPLFALVLFFLVAVAGILNEAMAGVGASWLNSSTSNVSDYEAAKAYYASEHALNGTVKLGTQLPTIGLILGVALFVLVAVLIIAYVKKLAKPKRKMGY